LIPLGRFFKYSRTPALSYGMPLLNCNYEP
jgi:hypothetical protein